VWNKVPWEVLALFLEIHELLSKAAMKKFDPFSHFDTIPVYEGRYSATAHTVSAHVKTF